ncbi:MAG TPA: NAD(+) synthase [Candidatus Gemmiger excrementigallinarum]|uniref:Glutamine-dependent NAD(+) synthetase n=1 Tax=Candidatus Gemmiger excrementigallinarum TaxID=2838609 RepID=A0A9D2J8Q6_9FIRM|nr:NAD(+) synthase [Candidatus Gemmiger excrementigallinarum]
MKYSFPAFENGFIRAAAISPSLRVADCAYNAQQIIEAMQAFAAENVHLLCLPEFSLTGYTCSDLFLQEPLLRGAEKALGTILQASKGLSLVTLVGLPVRHSGKLYNCAAVVCGGELLGLVPKTCLPNYGEFYEKRHFQPGMEEAECIEYAGQETLIGTRLLFACKQMPSFVLGVEICEDLWAPVPPSCAHALAGATVIANLSASDETIGKAAYRQELVAGQSARLLCAYLYADAGHGESTTDMTFAGHNLIAENGTILAQAAPFTAEEALTELDLNRMIQERQRNTTFVPHTEGYTTVEFEMMPAVLSLTREVSPTPFVPQDAASRAERCELILRIQAEGLAKRMEHTHARCAVVGISGGLDSCLALLVAVRACKVLERDTKDIVALTMPCFGTTQRTRSNAEILCEALGVTFKEINITNTVKSHFADIGQDPNTYDVTFENCQARVRTLELMDYANKYGGFVVGTGDLSELALGWATYNGDHMSMYGVNAGVPKTLVRHIVQYVADTCGNETLRSVLLDILDTPVSPELLPTAEDGTIAQQTENLVGPYELHDFYLYYVLRFGFGPVKIYHLARTAFEGRYEPEVLLHWLKNFYHRFFAQQFKRSCLPDGPKVGSVTLSPRGDWRMPSDACNALWMAELEEITL